VGTVHVTQPLRAKPTHAVLEVSWLPQAPPAGVPAWEDVTLHVPSSQFGGTSMQIASSDVLAIP
jgi:hypothetical protein